MEIRTIVEDFANKLTALIESQAGERAREVVLAALGTRAPIPGRRGRPRKVFGAAAVLEPRVRRKPPRQLCPVPRCKNPAAPVFGMVCAEHKQVPKSKIKKYRDARRAAKAAPG